MRFVLVAAKNERYKVNSIESIIKVKQNNRLYRTNRNKVNTSNNSIELPEEIDNLIDNKMYRNKFRKLIREGHLKDLLELAKLAQMKDKPSYWFARATKTKPAPGQEDKPTMWERTLKYLAKLRKVTRTVTEIAERIQAPAEYLKVVYAAYWRHGGNILRYAITAQETARTNPYRYFCWLTRKPKVL